MAMTEKPTDRILDWASGGTTTDPGGGKESAGWLVSERPPAVWWNWILSSFGRWLSYFDTLAPTHASCYVTNSDTLEWGQGVTSVTAFAFDHGSLPNTILVQLDEEYTVAPLPFLQFRAGVAASDIYVSKAVVTAGTGSGSVVLVTWYNATDGAIIDPVAEDIDFSFILVGELVIAP